MIPNTIQVGSLILYLTEQDERRVIYEFNDYDNDFAIQYIIILNEEPLGLHAHAKKEENFIIIKGMGFAITQLSHKGQRVYVKQGYVRTNLRPGSLIKINPELAHTFYLVPGTEIICHSSKAPEPNKPDIFPCPWLRM